MEGYFSMEVEPNFLALFKKQSENKNMIKLKIKFFKLKVRSNTKT